MSINKSDSVNSTKKRLNRTEILLRYWRHVLVIFFILILLYAYNVGAKAENGIIETISTPLVIGYNQSPLNVRAEMSVESEWLAQYPSQSTIHLLGDFGEWYQVELDGKRGFIKEEYVFASIEIYQRGKILQDATIYSSPIEESDFLGKVIKDDEELFVKKENGFLELRTGGFVKEEVVTFDFEQTVNIQESNITLDEMQSWNMINLPIHFLGTLAEKTPGQGVTTKSELFFRGDLPIYGFINGYAYFPSGRNIYKISMDKFSNIQNVGDIYDVLAAYRTVYYSSTKARKHNIALVSSYLDGTIIPSGKTFSYNKTTGPRNASMGYEQANVISNGEYVQDYGGGVCQVSSTIYAAIISSENDFRVTARKKHGLEVTYLPLDMDATVSYGSVDLKFENRFPFPVKLNVKTEDNGICLVTLERVN